MEDETARARRRAVLLVHEEDDGVAALQQPHHEVRRRVHDAGRVQRLGGGLGQLQEQAHLAVAGLEVGDELGVGVGVGELLGEQAQHSAGARGDAPRQHQHLLAAGVPEREVRHLRRRAARLHGGEHRAVLVEGVEGVDRVHWRGMIRRGEHQWGERAVGGGVEAGPQARPFEGEHGRGPDALGRPLRHQERRHPGQPLGQVQLRLLRGGGQGAHHGEEAAVVRGQPRRLELQGKHRPGAGLDQRELGARERLPLGSPEIELRDAPPLLRREQLRVVLADAAPRAGSRWRRAWPGCRPPPAARR